MKLIGTVVSEWSQLEYLRFALFMKLSGLSLVPAEAIFFTLRADRARNELLEALLRAMVPDKDERKPILDIHKRIRQLATRRNNFGHRLAMVSTRTGALVQIDPRQTPKAIEEDVSVDELKSLIHDILAAHYDYSNAIHELRIPSPQKSP